MCSETLPNVASQLLVPSDLGCHHFRIGCLCRYLGGSMVTRNDRLDIVATTSSSLSKALLVITTFL